MKLDILFRDSELLVVNKPSGMLVHRGWGRAPVVLVDLVRSLTRERKAHPVQRLDRAASGAILFALNPEMARVLKDMSERGEVAKRYLALVRGRPPSEGVIDHPIQRKEGGPRVPATTDFRLLASTACQPREVSLVEATPRTGRLHQIRRHLRHIGHPLIGDTTYGKAELNHAFTARYGITRLALHAREILLRRPGCAEVLRVTASLPEDLADPLMRMGLPPDPTRHSD
jgi:tRNA pseudouridine65 synthase